MKRPILLALLIFSALTLTLAYLNHAWIHRFDPLIASHAHIYGLDPDLVWSIIYEETYFRPWRLGADGEIGLMQVTPLVGREWAAKTGMRDLEKQMTDEPVKSLRDPERNIQVACWYLEEIGKPYRDIPGAKARIIAAYNAGPSRAAEWHRRAEATIEEPLINPFLEQIDIASTRAYASSILTRYERLRKVPREERRLMIFPKAVE